MTRKLYVDGPGQQVDATDLNNFAQIEDLFDYAPTAGNASQTFNVAPATTATEAVPLSQLQVVQTELQGSALNLCPDPGFTVGAGVWADANIVAASTLPAAVQSAPAANVLESTVWGLPSVNPFYIPVQPGDVLDCEVWVGSASTPASGAYGVGMMLFTFDANKANVAYPFVAQVNDNFTGWQKAVGSYTVPAGVAFIWLDFEIIRNNTPTFPGGGTNYFAAPRIVKRSAALNSIYNAVTPGTYTVATLPAGISGQRAFVTDATAPSFLQAVTGGGTVGTPVFYNGSAWIVG